MIRYQPTLEEFGGPGLGAAREDCFAKKMVSVPVQIVSYAKMETIEVPLKLSMGLGLR
ncbi:MAG: hypothetical protein ACI85K_000418 [Hyphomicrobiaceae bacterium]|jgi:hypothetical protein